MKKEKTNQSTPESEAVLRQELVEHFREKRELLRQQWVQQMNAKGLLAGLSQEEIENESITIYDTCIVCLETGEYEGAQTYAKRMAERGVLRGMTTEQIIGAAYSHCEMCTGAACLSGTSGI